jgi:hypothetical protein
MNPEFDIAAYKASPTITDFVNSNDLEDVVICYAHLGTGESHTFAADGRKFFDNNTGGVVVDAPGIHLQVHDMKVIKVLRRIRKRWPGMFCLLQLSGVRMVVPPLPCATDA